MQNKNIVQNTCNLFFLMMQHRNIWLPHTNTMAKTLAINHWLQPLIKC